MNCVILSIRSEEENSPKVMDVQVFVISPSSENVCKEKTNQKGEHLIRPPFFPN